MSRSQVCAVVIGLLGLHQAASAQTLQLEAITDTLRQVEVFGDGNVKGTVGQGDEATAASGSLGMRYNDGTFVVTGLINIAGTHTTATKSLGATLLSPATGGPLNAGLVDVRMPHLLSYRTCHDSTAEATLKKVFCTVGLHLYGSAATTRWATVIDDGGAVTDSVEVPFWGFGIGPSITFFSGKIDAGKEKKDVSMVLDFGLVSRHLRGDLFSQDTVRTRLIGTTKRDFYGLEIGLGLQFGNVRSGFSYYFLNGDVAGLSHGQVVAGVSVQASLLGGRVNDESANEAEPADDTAPTDDKVPTDTREPTDNQ